MTPPDRHKSILDYLSTNGLHQTFDALKAEAKQEDFQPDPKAKWSGLLEKKWTSVIRLQKKVRVDRRPLSSAMRLSPALRRISLELADLARCRRSWT